MADSKDPRSMLPSVLSPGPGTALPFDKMTRRSMRRKAPLGSTRIGRVRLLFGVALLVVLAVRVVGNVTRFWFSGFGHGLQPDLLGPFTSNGYTITPGNVTGVISIPMGGQFDPTPHPNSSPASAITLSSSNQSPSSTSTNQSSTSSSPLPKAYVVMIHGGLQTVEHFERRLWPRIYDESSFYAFHLSIPASEAAHAALRRLATGHPTAIVLPPRCITWGGPGQAALIIEAMRRLLKLGFWTHLIPISGAHYPIKPAWYRDQFLRANINSSFADGTCFRAESIAFPPTKECGLAFRDRLNCVYLDDCSPSAPNHTSDPSAKRFTSLGPRQNDDHYRNLNLNFFLGSQWLVLSRQAVEFVVSPRATRLWEAVFWDSGVPEESFFHTVLYNSPEIAPHLIPFDATFKVWTKNECMSSPCTFTSEHIHRLNETYLRQWGEGTFSALLFARKFSARHPDAYAFVDRVWLTRSPQDLPPIVTLTANGPFNVSCAIRMEPGG